MNRFNTANSQATLTWERALPTIHDRQRRSAPWIRSGQSLSAKYPTTSRAQRSFLPLQRSKHRSLSRPTAHFTTAYPTLVPYDPLIL
ncbi:MULTISPECIES: hypothetical protein [unclassified Spirosoma]|uniref:hypothetical protein n=1 Tax=unclassified Spirosoma TaxID=2621999 RepID=UPI001AD27074|nr:MULTISPECIES: hypothetical protein [unclassified Spirosoma]MBN8825959.1 hypothetical protein [Spirosoma sp.]